MILQNYKGTAVHPFPCPVIILKKTIAEKGKEPRQVNAIICGPDANFILATYRDIVPAKMELKRMIDQYKEDPDSLFIFMKDPYKEEENE